MSHMKNLFPDIDYAEDAYELAAGCDALLVVTEWNQFRDLDLERIKMDMNAPILIDGRNLYDPQKVKRLGFLYDGVGRGAM